MLKVFWGFFLMLSMNVYAQENKAVPSIPPAPASTTSNSLDDKNVTHNNVSTLNNQLVPIGEKHKYTYDYKKFNLGINLFLLPAEVISLSGSYAVTPHVVARVGMALNFSHKWGDKDFQINAGVPIYFQKAYTGFFVEPGIDSSSGFYVAGGYHWMWDSGFNTHIGMGVGSKGAVGLLQVSYAFGDEG